MEPLVNQALLIGDRLPFLTALFTINTSVAETLKGMDGMAGRSPAEICGAPTVDREVRRIVNRVNRQLAPFEQVRRFRILPRDFSIERGELTATMKVRRTKAIENFKQDIDALYAGRE
jgi:long-chain acyl-CoA synthetase